MIKINQADVIDPRLEAHFHMHQKLKYWTIVHFHDFHEIFIITEGTVIHIVNEVRQILAKGDLVFIRPNDVHSYEKYEEEEVELLNINFKNEAILDAFRFLGAGFQSERLTKSPLPLQVRLSTEEIRLILNRYDQITAIPVENISEIRTRSRLFLLMLLSEYFYPRMALNYEKGTPEWLRDLVAEMQKKENFTEGLEALYRLTSISQEHISRTILKHMNKTPTDWINELRLNYAAYLLKHSNVEVITISLECGFNSLSHFYKLFQKNHHVSPAKYRRAFQKTAIPQ